jgi:hypothetical protein
MLKHLDNYPINEDTTVVSQSGSAGFQAYNLLTRDNTLYERSLIDVFSYSYNSKKISFEEAKEIENTYKKVLYGKGIIHFYFPIEWELSEIEGDEARSNDEMYRKRTDKWMKDYLDRKNIRYFELRGSVEERYSKMKDILKSINT